MDYPSKAAESIVIHAREVCKHEDSLRKVLEQVSLPSGLFTDSRQQGKVAYETDELIRAFLYQHVRGLSQNELASRLLGRVSILKRLGFTDPPSQQVLNTVWNDAFDVDTREIIKTAAQGIRKEALDHNVVDELLLPTRSTDEEHEKGELTKEEAKLQQAQKLIQLARQYILPVIDSGRADNQQYSDEQIIDIFTKMCSQQGSANAEGEYAKLTGDDAVCSGATILRTFKLIATPSEEDAQLKLSAFHGNDRMPQIELIREAVLHIFNTVNENIINSINDDGRFNNRETIAAIDITHERFHPSPWKDKQKGVPRKDFPRMVSGYKKDEEFKRGFKYATLTLVGEHPPIILGIEPVKEDSQWEEDDAPSYPKASLVRRLLDKAQRFVDLDEVLLDRGFYSHGVFTSIHNHDIVYTIPVPNYEPDREAIEKIKSHPSAKGGVDHNIRVGQTGGYHTAEYLYVPTKGASSDDAYSVFITNRDHVAPEDAEAICNRYRRRWDIENQYKSIKSFLPKTSSKDYRVRFCNFALTSLIYNLWRLTDFLIKIAIDKPIRDPPVISARTFVRALSNFLRDIG